MEAYNTSRLDVGLSDALALTYGLEVYSDRQSGLRNGAPRVQFPDAGIDYRAGFVQAEVALLPGLSLIPGLRYDAFDYDNNAGLPERDDDRFSPKLALGYTATDDIYLRSEEHTSELQSLMRI